MYNNPADRTEVFDVPLIEENRFGLITLESGFQAFLFLIDTMTSDIPEGFLLVQQPWAPTLPAGIYRKGSMWTDIVLSDDGETQTVYRYQVRPVSALAGSSGLDSVDRKTYDLAVMMEGFFADEGLNFGITTAGYMQLRGKDTYAVTRHPSALLESLYGDGDGDGDGEKSELPILPILLGAIGFGVGGLGGGAAGFVMGQLLMGEKDKSSPGKRAQTIEELTTGTIPTGRG